MTIQTRRPVGGPFAIPALFAAIVTGFGIGFGRRPYRPRDPEPAAPPAPAEAAPQVDAGGVAAEFDAGSIAEAVSGGMPAPVADPVRGAAPAPDAAGAGDGEARKAPTPLGARVLAALQGRGPMRKAEIAALVQVGRGSGVRIVDRLVDDGWLRHHGDGLYAVA